MYREELAAGASTPPAIAGPKEREADLQEAPALARLRDLRLRPTMARIAILQVMEMAAAEPLSAEDVLRQLLLRNIRTGLASVYRILREFEEHGILRREYRPSRNGAKTLHRLVQQHIDRSKDRLMCTECGGTVVLDEPEWRERLRQLAQDQGLALAGGPLVIQTICASCSLKAASWAQ